MPFSGQPLNGQITADTNNSRQTLVSKSVVSNEVIIKKSTAISAPAVVHPVIVTIQPGDTLDSIAAVNNTTSLRIFFANGSIADPNVIFPNQQLRIPTVAEELIPRPVPTHFTQQTTLADSPPATSIATAAAPAVNSGSVWDNIAACESGGNWSIDTGNGFYGGLQFTIASWQGVGGSGIPSQASREEQISRAAILQSRSGWGAWPACSARLGL
jgi:LysM repeat protein